MAAGALLSLLFLALAAAALGVGMPLLLLHQANQWLVQRNYFRTARLVKGVTIVFLLICGYTVYASFFPPDSHYTGVFEEVVGVPFPASGEIVAGDESGLDPHGDYISCARIQVSREEYNHLLSVLNTDSSFRATDFSTPLLFVYSQQYGIITKELPSRPYSRTFAKGVVEQDAYRFVGFLRDHRSLIIYRCSS